MELHLDSVEPLDSDEYKEIVVSDPEVQYIPTTNGTNIRMQNSLPGSLMAESLPGM